VTGHRPEALRRDAHLVATVRTVLQRLGCGRGATILSPLAEGADRLVAVEAKALGATLGAVLPFPISRYLEDFPTQASKDDFLALLAEAATIATMPNPPTDEDGYLEAGHAVVDRADVMIALWDGLEAKGRGGTADIVEYAVDRGVPVVWIDSTGDHTISVLGETPEAQRILELVGPSRTA
jgi:hypothetical protein